MSVGKVPATVQPLPPRKFTANQPTSAVCDPVSARVKRRFVELVRSSVTVATPGLSAALYGVRPPRWYIPPAVTTVFVVSTHVIAASFCVSAVVNEATACCTNVSSVNSIRYHVRVIVWPVLARSKVRVVGFVMTPRTIFWPMLATVPVGFWYVNTNHDLAALTLVIVAVLELSVVAKDTSPLCTDASVY